MDIPVLSSGTIEMQHDSLSHSGTTYEKIIANLAQSSVELATNSKGQVQITVKVYAQTIEEAEKQALEAYDRLSAKYKQGV